MNYEDKIILDNITALGNNGFGSKEIFSWRKYYEDFVYPLESDKPFPVDFHNRSMTYGRINQERDWIYVVPHESHFKSLPNRRGGDTKLLNFVADAFQEFKVAIRNKITLKKMTTNSVYSNISPEYGWINPQVMYNEYLEILFSRFVTGYLEGIGRPYALGKSVLSFEGFMVAFLKWVAEDANGFPFTRTGYLSSNNITPRISGLCVETHAASFSSDRKKHRQFIDDPNFKAYRDLALQYGFRVDRHAPWRLVADITSNYMQQKMFTYGLNINNIFYKYFVPSYKFDIDTMKVVLYNWYNQYVTFFPQVKMIKTSKCKSHVFANSLEGTFVVTKYLNRQTFSSTQEFDKNFGAHYWLRQYAYVRMREVSANLSEQQFKLLIDRVYKLNQFKNFDKAVTHINKNVKKYQPNVIMEQPASGATVGSATGTSTGEKEAPIASVNGSGTKMGY